MPSTVLPTAMDSVLDAAGKSFGESNTRRPPLNLSDLETVSGFREQLRRASSSGIVRQNSNKNKYLKELADTVSSPGMKYAQQMVDFQSTGGSLFKD
jgi:hypothetical protein